MESLAEVDEKDFEDALRQDPQHVRMLRILYMAFGGGVLLFAAIVIGLFYTSVGNAEGERHGIVRLLSSVHLPMALGLWLAAFMSGNFFYSPGNLKRAVNMSMSTLSGRDPTPAQKCLFVIRMAIILRTALLEGVALFGIVICLLGANSGALRENPIYWLNLSSTGVLVLSLALTFPSHQRLIELFRYRFVTTRAT